MVNERNRFMLILFTELSPCIPCQLIQTSYMNIANLSSCVKKKDLRFNFGLVVIHEVIE